MTHGTFDTIPLQLSNAKSTVENKHYELRFTATLRTKRLALVYLNPDYTFRLQLLKELSKKGLTNKEISEFLNLNEVTPARTTRWTPKLVWGTLKKIQRRDQKREETNVTVSEMTIHEV